MPTSDAPRALVVCRANRIRSAIAEHLLREAFQRASLDWAVRSCGTHAEPGLPLDPVARQYLTDNGVPVSPEWRTTPLRRELLAEADLVLTAEATQRSIAVELLPAALHRTFTLRQLARIADHAGTLPARFRHGEGQDLLVAITRARSAQPVDPAADDIPDPAGRRPARRQQSAHLVEQAVIAIARAFAGGSALR